MSGKIMGTGDDHALGSATVRIDDRGDIVRLTLDQPPLNTIDIDSSLFLAQAIRTVVSRPELKVLILLGGGNRAFSAGISANDRVPEKVPEMLDAYHSIFLELDHVKALTIAAVRGVALGAGFELATFCDLVVAEDTARFGLPEIKLGSIPTVAAITLPEMIGVKRSQELILSGDPIDAKQALNMGLVTRLAKHGNLENELEDYLKVFEDKSPVILRAARNSTRRGPHGADLREALHRMEKIYMDELMTSHDGVEGITAFLERRSPNWKGI